MKYINKFCRYFVGILFIISGFIKLNDPIGTAIKLEEYFEVFSSDFNSAFHHLKPFSLGFAVGIIVFEVVLGVALLINYKMRITAWLLLLLILFFSVLTFYSAYFNKVTDCGCFGDALKLTPWTSFTKDIVLLVFILTIFLQRKVMLSVFPGMKGDIIMALIFLFTLYVAYFTVNHLPFIDFRAYRTGANIPRLMKASAPIRYRYVLTKDGKEYEFTTYPADTSYKFKSMEVINEEDLPKITDYAIWNDEGDVTQESLSGKKLLLFVLDANKASLKNMEKIRQLVRELENMGVLTWLVTASDYNTISTFRNENQLAIPYYYADATVIKTIMRSNPGLVLLQDGVVRAKWHHKDTPEAKDVIAAFK